MSYKRSISKVAARLSAVTLAAWFLAAALPVATYAQTTDEEKCINAMNKSGSKVAAAQGKENSSCIKNAGKGTLTQPTTDDCLIDDPKGKVSGAQTKVTDTALDKCSGAAYPPFGFTSAPAVNAAAKDEELALTEDIYGSPVDPAISTNGDDAKCQSAVTKAYEKYGSTIVKNFLKCKKDGLKLGTVNSSLTLTNTCIFPTDAKSTDKQATSLAKIVSTIDAKCEGVTLATLFPGECTLETGTSTDLGNCLADAAECRMCLYINDADGTTKGCDTLDDGNGLNGSCRQCGNGFTEAPEACDGPGETPTCDPDCTLVACGDGYENGAASETCDDGNLTNTDPCPSTCLDATCGDGFLCSAGGCTTGPTGGTEQCDNGGANSDVTPDACRTNCANPSCGDGVTDTGEDCDDSGESATCDDDCTFVACGDGNLNGAAGENCDDGNLSDNDSCPTTCQPASCGDGFLCSAGGCTTGPTGGTEQCDDDGANSNVTPDACRTNCANPSCGDNVTDTGEQCDGGGVNTPTCDSNCTLAACHDGFLNTAAGEVCDDGNVLNNDPCVGTCVLATCGDGFLCSAGGCTTGPTGGTEQCDNDGANSDVTPDACRTDCANPGCGDNVTDTGETCDTGGNSPSCDADCTGVLCGDGFTNPTTGEQCDGPGETATCDPDCTNAICNDGYINVTKGEECEDGNVIGGDGCSSTCTCGLGSGEVGCQDANCPGSGEIVLFAGVREQACTTNVDCEVDGELVGECDTGLGQCVTVTDLDTGWTGIAHNSDINDVVVTRGSLLCPGPFDGMSATPCGECEILGLSPETDLCRCSNDNQAICDDTFSLDSDDCGVAKSCSTNADCKVCNITTSTSCNLDVDCPVGEYCMNGLRQPTCSGGTCIGTCNCYFGPPLPLSSGSTPACALNRFAVDVSGTANVDLGEGEVTANLKASVFLGELVTVPCPYCDGDVTPRDGIRDGTCEFGDNDGDACDVQATNMTFPAPDGAGHSLDCFPASGKNVSGTGLTINLVQSTGSDTLTAGVLCGFPPFAPESCPCGQCSGDTSVPCTANADCTGIGTCVRDALGKPRADGCSDSPVPGVCEVFLSVCTGDGETVCTSNVDCAGPGGTCVGVEGQCPALNGPTDKYCDGVFRSSGEPYVTCNNNADCDATDCGSGVGVGLCGTCSLTSLRKCFLDPIYVFGKPDPGTPIGAAAFCIPKTANTGINDVAGLPGPARVKNATRAKTFCSSLPSQEYVPGTGGCP